MAKREISSTLKNLKFMQRAALKEDKTKKEEEVKPEEPYSTTGTIRKRCVVITEGDPQPGLVKGRLSFGGFNPSIDKLREESSIPNSTSSTASAANQTGEISFRENKYSPDANVSECSKNNDEINGDMKRKQSDSVSESQRSNKSPKNVETDKQSSLKINGSFKKPKLDWALLRPSTFKKKTDEPAKFLMAILSVIWIGLII